MGFGADAALTGIPVVGDLLAGAANASAVKDAYKHRYQWEVNDLKKAGLNPALAYGHQPSTPQVGTMPDLGSSAARGFQAMSQGKASAAQQRLTSAQAGLLEAQTSDLVQNLQLKNTLLGSQIGQIGRQGALTSAQTETERQRLTLVKQQVANMRMDYQWQSATWDTRIALLQGSLKKQGIEIGRAEIEKALAELRKPGAEAESRFYETMGAGGTNSALMMLKILSGLIR